MSDSIESLVIEIRSDAGSASSQFEKLIGSLNSLKGAVSPAVSALQDLKSALSEITKVGLIVSFGSFNREISGLMNALSGINATNLDSLIELSRALKIVTDNLSFIDADLGQAVVSASLVKDIIAEFQSINAGTDVSGIEQLMTTCRSISRIMRSLSSASNYTLSAGAVKSLKSSINLLPGIVNALSRIPAYGGDSAQLQNLSQALAAISKIVRNLSVQSGDASAAGFENIASGIASIIEACRQIDDDMLERLRALASALQQVQNAGGFQGQVVDASGPTGAASSLNSTVLNFGAKAFGVIGNTAKSAYSDVTGVLKGVGNTIGWFADKINPANSVLGDFVRSLARIAKYRLLRTIIKGITSGAREGLQNLAYASSEANSVLSQLSSGALTLKNSMGAALYSAIEPMIGVLNSIVRAAVRAMDALSMLFSILAGKATFKKATSSTKSFTDALGGAAGGAKELKQQLMGFDEINALSPDSGGAGGGGGGIGLPDYGGMFEDAPVSQWLKDMIEAGDFTEFGIMVADKINKALEGINWKRIKSGAKKLASSITTAINGFFGKIDPKIWGQTIGELINMATTFIGDFWTQTDWYQIGQKVQGMIRNALATIDAKQLAVALTGKFNAIVKFLVGLLPSTSSEWDEITDKIAEFINEAIRNIDANAIGKVIASVITGGLRLIKSLGQNGTLTNIAKAVVSALKTAFSGITRQDIEDAFKAVKDDILNALKVVFSVTVNIGGVDFSAAGLVIGGYAVFNVLKGAFSQVFSGVGKSPVSGLKTLTMFGGIAFGIKAALSVKALVDDVKNGNDITLDQVISILSDSLTSIGLTLIGSGHLVSGLIVFSIGIAIKPIVQSIGEMHTASSETMVDVLFGPDFQSEIDAALDKAVRVEDILPIFEELTGQKIGVKDFFTILDAGMEGVMGYDGAVDTLDEARVSVSNLFAMFGQLKSSGVISTWDEFFNLILGDTGKSTTALDSFSTSAKNTITELGKIKIVTALGNLVTPVENLANSAKGYMDDVVSALSLKKFNTSSATSKFDKIDSSATNTVSKITAVGTAASHIGTIIIEIPTEKEVTIEIKNYSTLVQQLSGIQKKISNLTGAVVNIKVKAGLTSGAKTFLRALRNIDAGITSRINALLNASQFASGGYPKSGDLFFANENGRQEMIGRIGNRNAVANQDQIGDAIFRYMDEHDRDSDENMPSADAIGSAVASALMRAGIGSVYLEGRDLARAINKESQRAGHPVINF